MIFSILHIPPIKQKEYNVAYSIIKKFSYGGWEHTSLLARAYPSFHSMKQLRVFLLPLAGGGGGAVA